MYSFRLMYFTHRYHTTMINRYMLFRRNVLSLGVIKITQNIFYLISIWTSTFSQIDSKIIAAICVFDRMNFPSWIEIQISILRFYMWKIDSLFYSRHKRLECTRGQGWVLRLYVCYTCTFVHRFKFSSSHNKKFIDTIVLIESHETHMKLQLIQNVASHFVQILFVFE